ncbi:DNA mismatch repair endonuclease MutL [Mesotoga prima]|uniref:DNA mismatch repair endonuclease MutL n=1 Tax=Mesotoga prima TaxID=1184387 RepID=UPI002B79641C|nr:DNA mismatch repair endonuclease MutL [Mesotoga prima]HPJ32216.1 DNA mismatch repair endonuclease MutL [Mesotoga prima]
MRIHELPTDVVRKIAAGEVVTGCFSVVKELVENSIDAGASLVEIEIKAGGKEYIMVRDNGSGMTNQEAKLAIKPHTTSKISSIEDLDSLITFGFRGEALSTIASVSRMRLSTAADSEELGTILEIAGGSVTGQKPFSGSNGTLVEVFDLLYNTPARRKFLKSASIEGRMVTEMIQRFILAFENVDFVYSRDSQTVFDTRGAGSLQDRIALIYPGISTRDLIPVSGDSGEIKVSGYVTLPSRTRKNRMGENIFVNGRYVRQFELNYALERGYGETLQKGNFPFAVLFIDIDPQEVDVNIHPQKLEVKFASTAAVLDEVKRAVRSAIKGAGHFTINIVHSEENITGSSEERKDASEIYQDREVSNHGFKHPWRNQKVFDNNASDTYTQSRFDRHLFRSLVPAGEREGSPEKEKSGEGKVSFIGVFGERYLIAESEDGLMLIDQHAAHERIIFEALKESKRIAPQNLLMPLELSLERSKMDLIIAREETLKKLGFTFDFVNDKIIMVSIPQVMGVEGVVDMLEEILDEMRLEGLEDPKTVFDNLLASIACKAAIRTGNRLDIGQAEELFEELRRKNLLVCPHGRPISMVIRLEDLDRYFSR